MRRAREKQFSFTIGLQCALRARKRLGSWSGAPLLLSRASEWEGMRLLINWNDSRPIKRYRHSSAQRNWSGSTPGDECLISLATELLCLRSAMLSTGNVRWFEQTATRLSANAPRRTITAMTNVSATLFRRVDSFKGYEISLFILWGGSRDKIHRRQWTCRWKFPSLVDERRSQENSFVVRRLPADSGRLPLDWLYRNQTNVDRLWWSPQKCANCLHRICWLMEFPMFAPLNRIQPKLFDK